MHRAGKLHDLASTKPPDGAIRLDPQPLDPALDGTRATSERLRRLIQHGSNRAMGMKVLP